MGDLNVSTVGNTVYIKQQKSWGTEEVSIAENEFVKTKRCGKIGGKELCLTEVDLKAHPKFRGRGNLSATEGQALDLISNAANKKIKMAETLVKTDPVAAAKALDESKRLTALGEIAYANIRSRGKDFKPKIVLAKPADTEVALSQVPEKTFLKK